MSESEIVKLIKCELEQALEDYDALVKEFEEVKQYYEAKIAVAKRDLKKQ